MTRKPGPDAKAHRWWRRRRIQKVLQFQVPWRLCAKLPTRVVSGRFGAAGV